MSLMPKVATNLRSTSYGGSPPCSMSLILGTTSASTNRRIASRIDRCISDHSIMVGA